MLEELALQGSHGGMDSRQDDDWRRAPSDDQIASQKEREQTQANANYRKSLSQHPARVYFFPSIITPRLSDGPKGRVVLNTNDYQRQRLTSG